MSIIKKSKSNFAVVPREIMANPDLSLKAKGLLAYLLCMPDNWQVYVSQLSTVHKESKNTIGKIVNELIEHGYVTREQKRGDNNRFAGYDYSVYDLPISQKAISQKAVSQKAVHGKLVPTKKDYTKKDYTKKENKLALSSDFQTWWDAYGKHGNRKTAEVAYRNLTKVDKVNALVGVEKYVNWLKAKGDYKTSFQKHGATYLNKRGWEDELPKLEKMHASPTHSGATYSQGTTYNPNI